MQTVEVIVPLADYELRLLTDFAARFPDRLPVVSPKVINYAFGHWYWSKRSCSALYRVFSDDCELHQGCWSTIWQCFAASFEDVNGVSELTRVALVKRENVARLEAVDASLQTSYVFKYYEPDFRYWELIARMVAFYQSSNLSLGLGPQMMRDPQIDGEASLEFEFEGAETDNESERSSAEMSIDGSAYGSEVRDTLRHMFDKTDAELDVDRMKEWDFQVWSMIRSCTSLLTRAVTADFFKTGIKATGFYMLHEAVPNGFIRTDVIRSVDGGSGPMRVIEGVKGMGLAPTDTNYGLLFELSPEALRVLTFGEDPVKFVEYIDWGELEACSPSGLEPDFANLAYVTRTSAHIMRYERLLYTEEDVFASCVDSGKVFPDYELSGRILFAVTPISDFQLETTRYGGYWGHWSDCSITYNPTTGDWHLLQTVPGLRFRKLYNSDYNSLSVACKYFRGIVNDMTAQKRDRLSDILQLYYRPDFEYVLEVIPFDQISSIDHTALRQGFRGVVYRATWSRPASVGEVAADVDVVLKSIKVEGSEDVSRFMRELDATLALAQGAGGIRCVKLFGILKTPPRPTCPSSQKPLLPPDTLFLVLEYASQGSLRDHLAKLLSGSAADWEPMSWLAYELVAAVAKLHTKGIIHRDIHWGNILVGERRVYSQHYKLVMERVILVSDLGESQIMGAQSMGRTYYGNPHFWAPELKDNHAHTQASDVFAVGRLLAEMMMLQWELCRQKTGTETCELPRELLDAILAMQQYNPEQRPQLSEVLSRLDRVLILNKESGRIGQNLVTVKKDVLLRAPERPQGDEDSDDDDDDEIPI